MNRLLNLSVVLLMVSGKCSIIYTNISTMANSCDLLQKIILIRVPNNFFFNVNAVTLCHKPTSKSQYSLCFIIKSFSTFLSMNLNNELQIMFIISC